MHGELWEVAVVDTPRDRGLSRGEVLHCFRPSGSQSPPGVHSLQLSPAWTPAPESPTWGAWVARSAERLPSAQVLAAGPGAGVEPRLGLPARWEAGFSLRTCSLSQ